mmetsp:Transcript_26276/g.60439  ORF Transcript_26276/g.60439 Transcript_26276/m.60439 type:complete len:167 (+) Transcript_26276:2263-2763(+)
MVVAKVEPSATREFDAEICVLKGEGTTIRRSYQAYVHILNVRQSAFAKHIEMIKTGTVVPVGKEGKRDEEGCVVLRPGARAKVRHIWFFFLNMLWTGVRPARHADALSRRTGQGSRHHYRRSRSSDGSLLRSRHDNCVVFVCGVVVGVVTDPLLRISSCARRGEAR